MRDRLAFFSGRVEVEAKGNQIEQFINQLHRHRIPMQRPCRMEDGTLHFVMPCRAFKQLRAPAFKTGTRIRILKKRGLFMAIRPFRRRWGLAVGLPLFLGLVFYSSCFIWQIEVVGCEETSATEILSDLAELGLEVGCRRSIDVEPIENRYLTGNEKLSWMSVNIRGTTAYVEVREKGLKPQVVDLTVPSNIYASRDGVILSVMDYGGTRQVQVGEAVAAGDLLVSGDWTDQYGVRHLTRSIATVRAETQHKTTLSVPLREHIRQKTGKKRNYFAFFFGKFKFPLYFTQKISYNEYDTMVEYYPLKLGSFVFPIRLQRTRVEEVRLQEVTRSEKEAEEVALSRLGFFEKDVLADAVVRKRELQKSLDEECLQLIVTFYCEEEIGVELPINTENAEEF
ncbi:MAG: sporulation protein YqfD [Clostridia bacterium]|nr:sporulation protein YqfD [Clostridia bacterium]